MGGSVAVSVAAHPLVDQVIGLAPWLPTGSTSHRYGAVASTSCTARSTAGSPASPGVPASLSRGAVARARALGIATSYRLVRGGVHGLAARTRVGVVRFPRADEWLEGVDAVLLT